MFCPFHSSIELLLYRICDEVFRHFQLFCINVRPVQGQRPAEVEVSNALLYGFLTHGEGHLFGKEKVEITKGNESLYLQSKRKNGRNNEKKTIQSITKNRKVWKSTFTHETKT